MITLNSFDDYALGWIVLFAAIKIGLYGDFSVLLVSKKEISYRTTLFRMVLKWKFVVLMYDLVASCV